MRCKANPGFTVKDQIPIICSAAVWQRKRWETLPGRWCTFGMFRSSLALGMLMFVIHFCGAEALSTADDARVKERVFQESREIFPNPERGFYSPVKTGRMKNPEGLRQQGISLLLVETDLREFKERDLLPEKLTEIREAFAAARRAGLKVIFRAAYGYTGR